MSESEIFHRLAKYNAADIQNYVRSVTESMGDGSYLRSLINKRNSPQKYTPLHVAIFSRNMDAVKAFVDMGVREFSLISSLQDLYLVETLGWIDFGFTLKHFAINHQTIHSFMPSFFHAFVPS